MRLVMEKQHIPTLLFLLFHRLLLHRLPRGGNFEKRKLVRISQRGGVPQITLALPSRGGNFEKRKLVRISQRGGGKHCCRRADSVLRASSTAQARNGRQDTQQGTTSSTAHTLIQLGKLSGGSPSLGGRQCRSYETQDGVHVDPEIPFLTRTRPRSSSSIHLG